MSTLQELLKDLGQLEPKSGWTRSSYIRPLTDPEIAVCLIERTSLATVPDFPDNFAEIVAAILSKKSSPGERAADIGAVVRIHLHDACREWLLQELMLQEDSPC